MGQKTNPIGLRTAVTKDWASKWYSDKKGFAGYMAEDRAIRDLLYRKLENAAVTKILIERAAQRVAAFDQFIALALAQFAHFLGMRQGLGNT